MNQESQHAQHLHQARITGVTITPVAFKDPPLLNTVGVQQRQVLERHRRDRDAGNPHLVEVLCVLVFLIHSGVLLRRGSGDRPMRLCLAYGFRICC